MSWHRQELQAVAIVSWGDTTTTKKSYSEEGFPAYSASGQDGFLKHFDHAGLGIVLSAIGAQCGKTWLADGYWSCIKNTMFIKGLCGKAHTEYLYYALSEPSVWPRRGAAQPFISKGDAQRVLVSVPPLPVQRRIADILSAYDDLIENNNRRMALLEESIHLLYREWFVYLRFPGHERTKIVDGVPEGWEKRPVKDSFSYLGGGTPSRKRPELWVAGTVDWYSPTDLTRSGALFMEGSKEKINELGLAQSSARLFPAWSVMLTSRATIGAVAINTAVSTTNQGFINCLPNVRVPLYFLYCWLMANSEEFVARATGATFKELSKSKFGTIPILLPPEALVAEFNCKVKPFAEQVLTLQRQNDRLREARDLLLPRLMDGRTPV